MAKNGRSLSRAHVCYGGLRCPKGRFYHRKSSSRWRPPVPVCNAPPCFSAAPKHQALVRRCERISRSMDAYRREGRISDAPHKRHPRATTAAQDADILDAAKASPFREIGAAAGVSASASTIKRRLAETEEPRCGPEAAPLLAKQDGASSIERGRTAVNVWGAVSRDGLGVLRCIEGPLTSAKYCDILDYVMIPYALDGPFPDGDFLFQQDLSPVHTAKVVEELLNMRGVRCLRWVPKGADLNIIVWGRMKLRLCKRGLHSSSADELWSAVEEEWMRLQNERSFIDNLYASLQSRMQDVIAVHGGHDPLLRRGDRFISRPVTRVLDIISADAPSVQQQYWEWWPQLRRLAPGLTPAAPPSFRSVACSVRARYIVREIPIGRLLENVRDCSELARLEGVTRSAHRRSLPCAVNTCRAVDVLRWLRMPAAARQRHQQSNRTTL
ncbi:hypothetical protein HPB50_011616 [Hyalomma asiaticum]|uniref:Uncharacterized protein n=1 Tax=Hyalomma asiaticum TaxID=266040 RepID=A0ACB7TMM4_HYAAI|nr:hypothetical protein HPB50_011616 [Hyalomma asiaticum]